MGSDCLCGNKGHKISQTLSVKQNIDHFKLKIMERWFTFICLLFFSIGGYSQPVNEGTVVTRTFLAPSIQNNKGGEDANRRITVYLPSGYEKGNRRYPTIYFLHGFASDDNEMMEWLGFKRLMDSAIKSGKLKPMILVLPNSDTKYRGSFYTNSPLAGNWADYIGKDVVDYVDKSFRTITHRDSRGLCGHSMGGNGALRIGMLYASTFSAVYAMSPGGMHFSNEFQVNHKALKKLLQVRNMDSLLKKATPTTNFEEFPFFEMVFASLARAYSPDENNKLLQAELPVRYEGKSMILKPEVLKKWEANFPINMVEDHLPGLKSLSALKIDWGRNEEFFHIPSTAMQFSKKLEAYGVKHFAEEYIGTHVSHLDGFEGRIFTELLPFFDSYLRF